ncbi:uracil-DNA glycosylase [Paenibacillus dendritiformis]|uniref:uracil-DNA glycosylase n=2 Tax=Paenibacillus dendritiformis TaxID=130049 RepID=UPI001F54F44E|nr:uracil-DNA glycosylase [Paenibacillus dendritiformis]
MITGNAGSSKLPSLKISQGNRNLKKGKFLLWVGDNVFIACEREDRQGNSFLCGTRETLQHAMREAGIDTNAVYITYLLKCRPMRAYNKPEARAACIPHLQLQLLEKQPSVLFGFGNVVAEAIFPQKENASVKELRGSWHEFQGIPISFTYHPLAVRRRPNLLRLFVEDLKALKEKWKERSTPAT